MIVKNNLTKRQKEVMDIIYILQPSLLKSETITRKQIEFILRKFDENWDGKGKKLGYPKFLTVASNRKSFGEYYLPVDAVDVFDDEFSKQMSRFGILKSTPNV